jgi:hypothetical protein
MLYTHINRFLLGTWVLRASNDNFYKNGYTSLRLYDDNTLKLKTIYKKGTFAEKKSISGNINIISTTEDSTILEITYSKYNIYYHSAFGIQIPEIKSKNRTFTIKRKFEAKIIDNSLLILDTKSSFYSKKTIVLNGESISNFSTHKVNGESISNFSTHKVNGESISNFSTHQIPLYYLFDLQISQTKSPYIEISFSTFIFSQMFSILLNLFLMNMINLL